METDNKNQINYNTTGIKTLKMVSTALFFVGVISAPLLLIGGIVDGIPIFIAYAIIDLLAFLFFSAVGRVLATIAEIKLIEHQSKQPDTK